MPKAVTYESQERAPLQTTGLEAIEPAQHSHTTTPENGRLVSEAHN